MDIIIKFIIKIFIIYLILILISCDYQLYNPFFNQEFTSEDNDNNDDNNNSNSGSSSSSSSSSSSTGSTLNDGLIAFWQFENNTLDSAGSNDGVLNGATYTPGRSGQGLLFDGIDDYVDIPADPCFGLNEFTISAWVYIPMVLPANGPANWGAILVHSATTQDHYGLWESGSGDFFHFRATFVGIMEDCTNYSTAISPNIWYLVTGTFNHDTDEFVCYFNDSIDTSFSSLAEPSPLTNNGIHIGTGVDPTPGNQNFTGIIDEVRIYNRALSASEVAELYNSY